jgi:methylenetetrahydrofolate dehydrogenase (NADP+)/methenyltetrahydrofolate cyclohydrolase
MSAKIINGKEIAKEIRKNISTEVENLKLKYKTIPNITTIKIGNDPTSDLYLKLREKACDEVGIISNNLEFNENISESKVLKEIKLLNKNKNVHGILIQLPLPNHISFNKLINLLDPKKDVEGLNPYNLGRTLVGNEYIIPITPLSILTILDYEKTDLKGKEIVIINHSNIIGKPLAILLLNRNATVSVCNVFTKDLKLHSSNADILITAAGVPKLINIDHVKKESFIIDVATISIKDGICGDVDFYNVLNKVGKITPVPGGVGPVTVACSLKNMIKTFMNLVED